MTTKVIFDLATSAEVASELENFIHEHGPNEWNHLPQDGVRETFRLIKEDKGEIVCARVVDTRKVLGIGIYLFPESLPVQWTKYVGEKRAVFIAEMCIHKNHTGKGLGSQILVEIAARMAKTADMLLMDRHEENAASAGMMHKVGCKLIDTFDDSMKRTTGSRRTAVLKMDL